MGNTTKKNATPKKRLVVSYKNLKPEVLELVKEKYPKGYSDYVIKVDKGNGEYFYAITLDTEDTSYLIKVDVKVDMNADDVEKDLFGADNSESEDFTESDEAAEFADDAEDE